MAAINDLDNDGIQNSKDLDSDNDGCPDLVESGAGSIGDSLVTQSGAFTSVGTNGLADHLETNVDSDTIIYFLQQFQFDSLLNACDDWDGDGIGDLVDIDDDNDGILDVEEGCDYSPLNDISASTFPNCDGNFSIDWEAIAGTLTGGGTFEHPTLGNVVLTGTSGSNIRIGTTNNSGSYLNFSNNNHTLTLSWDNPASIWNGL